ncbi:MAG TPA: 30S ribosomal protein S8 [Patescibacteria group bacterium]|jgi:small subunit ribosomal protein S8|nr:30S ribosomal protein S8 [Patescibacteria group bacterium]
MMTDPIADMLTRIRNAMTAKHARTQMPASRMKAEIAKILKEEGYIDDFKRTDVEGKANLVLMFRYGPSGERVITGIERVSKSGRRIYVGKDEIPEVLAGLGTTIISTPQGLMTGTESRRRGLGGEVICNIW